MSPSLVPPWPETVMKSSNGIGRDRHRQLVIHYQPKIALVDGKLDDVEALVR
jgi:EAL domain-containing protein (putative c-di-GMP-specific phosphodiesterase class I)